MTNLRDRIAAVLQSTDHRLAVEDEMPIGLYYASVADAVIEALDLGSPCATDGCRMRRIAREGFGKYGENYGI